MMFATSDSGLLVLGWVCDWFWLRVCAPAKRALGPRGGNFPAARAELDLRFRPGRYHLLKIIGTEKNLTRDT